MSETQLAIVASFCAVALVPLLVTLVVFLLTKTKLVATPIENRVVVALTAGGWMGLVFMAPGMGAGVAAAGVWLGILAMVRAEGQGHILTILSITPAATVIVVTGMILWAP